MKTARPFLQIVLLACLLYAGYIFVYGNFHRVDKEYFRSAQLFSFNMPYYIEKNGIKSVLNLRGTSNEEWYRDEVRISRKYNIAHYDFRINDREPVKMQEMNNLVKIINDAPKPILVHCRMGADRTSLATALYLYSIKHTEKADNAMSILYGHFPWLGSKTKAMDDSLKRFEEQKSYIAHL